MLSILNDEARRHIGAPDKVNFTTPLKSGHTVNPGSEIPKWHHDVQSGNATWSLPAPSHSFGTALKPTPPLAVRHTRQGGRVSRSTHPQLWAVGHCTAKGGVRRNSPLTPARLLRQLRDIGSSRPLGGGAAKPALSSSHTGKYVLPGKKQMRTHSSAATLGSSLITRT